MDVKEAVGIAKAYLGDLFADEEIRDVGLEEVKFDHESNHWDVTIGFARPWDQGSSFTAAIREGRLARSFKVIRINGASGTVESLKDRLLRD